MGQLENKLLTIEYRRKIELFAATTIRQLIVLIYKRDLHCLRSVVLFNHVIHYCPETGFPYYNMTTPIERGGGGAICLLSAI
jgi:hypothetical protein